MKRGFRMVLSGSVVFGCVAMGPATRADQSAAHRQEVVRLLERYEQTGATGFVAFPDRDAFVDALGAMAPGWIAAAPDANRERRRRIVALLPLESAYAMQPVDRDQLELIKWGCEFLRRGPPTEFERIWMLASLGLIQRLGLQLQRQMPASDLIEHIGHAEDRFRDDPRIRLSRLLQRPEVVVLSSRPGAPPQRLVNHGPDRSRPGGGTDPAQIAVSLRGLQALVDDPGAGAEARVHVGLLKFHLNQLDDAIKDLRVAAASTADPFVQNLAWLVAGLAFEAQGRSAEATEAWKSAVAAVPAAKASATALAARLFLAGRRVDAAQVVDQAYRADPPVLDPWRRIAADIRFVPGYMAWLRASVGHGPPVRPAAPPTFGQPELIALSDPESPGGRVGARVETEARQDQPAFRATASMVAVPVSVRDRNVPVAGLTALDFELFDNGVRQTIQTVDRSAVPVDVSVVVDVYDESRVHEPGRYAGFLFVSQAARIKEDILTTDAAMLRADDRIAVTLIGNEPWEVLRLDSSIGLPADRLNIQPLPLSYRRDAALYDAVATRLVHVGQPDRRHLVVVFSSGLDDASVLTPDLLKAMAAQTDAVVHVVRRSTVAEQRALRGSSGAISSHLLWPADPKVIEEVARLTGGQVFFQGGVGSLVEPIRRILDEFRQSYVLRYQPTGVRPGGWHEVVVRVSKPGGYDVKARRGYFGGE